MKKIIALLQGILILCSCGSVKRASTEYKDDTQTGTIVLSWQEWLHAYSKGSTDENRLVVVNLIDSVYNLMEDPTKTSTDLEPSICKLSEVMGETICTDTMFGFTQMMRATAHNFTSLFPFDLERLGAINCVYHLMGTVPNLWLTRNYEKGDMMCNSLIVDSWSAMERFAYVVLSSNEETGADYAAVILVNSIDTVIDAVVISFFDEEGNQIEGPLGLGEIDASDAETGCVRLYMSLKVFMHNIANSLGMTITYNTGKETISMAGILGLTFKEQLESCPRLKAIMEDY